MGGRLDEALATTSQAVEIYRRLAGERPDAFEPDLARSLSNLAVMLTWLGRWKEAMAARSRAIQIRRRLAAAHPDAAQRSGKGRRRWRGGRSG